MMADVHAERSAVNPREHWNWAMDDRSLGDWAELKVQSRARDGRRGSKKVFILICGGGVLWNWFVECPIYALWKKTSWP